MNNLHAIENEDTLFFYILALTMVLYFLATAVFIHRKIDVSAYQQHGIKGNRFTRLIIEMNLPSVETKKIEKIVVDVAEEKKKISQERKKRKVVVKENKLLKKVGASKVEKDRTTLKDREALQVIGSIDDSFESLDIVDTSSMLLASIDAQPMSAAFETVDLFINDSEFDLDKEKLSGFQDEEEILAQVDHQLWGIDETAIQLTEGSFPSRHVVIKKNSTQSEDVRETVFIEKKVSAYSDGIKFCYDKILRKEQQLSGKIIIRFSILSSGITEEVSMVSSQIHDVHLEECILDVVARWTFPSSSIEKIVVTYPLFLFSEKM